MSEWKECRLGDIAHVIPGYAFRGKDFGSIGYHVVKIGDINPPIVDLSNCIKIPDEKVKGLDKFKLRQGDFVLAMTGATLGKVGRYSSQEIGYLNQRVAKFENKPGLSDKKFLYYLITNSQVTNEIINRGLGSAQPNISGRDIESIIVDIPSLPTQTAIAEILSSLDDKIELNNKINQELEALAQTLFKQWFVDFEFPNEKGEPYKSSGGEMVDSELGEIPKGWDIVKVQDLEHKLQTGTRPKGGVGGITNGVPSVGAESVKKLGYYDFSKVKFVTEEFAAKMKRGKVEGYELLIYKDGGKPGTFIPHFSMFGEGFPFDTFFINEHVFLLDFFNKQFNCFCYFYFDSVYVKPVFENNGGKAAIPGINQEDVKHLWVFNPDLELVKLFGHFALSSVSTILKNCKENIQLTNLRDTLLPKLISGELEVKSVKF
jgi:type I restriction enzyme S subunit